MHKKVPQAASFAVANHLIFVLYWLNRLLFLSRAKKKILNNTKHRQKIAQSNFDVLIAILSVRHQDGSLWARL